MAVAIKTVDSKKQWILMLYSAFHMLNVNYLECGMLFNLCLLFLIYNGLMFSVK